jgi:hypothetical protein
MPAETRCRSIKTSPGHGDGAVPGGGNARFYRYIIAMLAVRDTVAVLFVLKTAIYLML